MFECGFKISLLICVTKKGNLLFFTDFFFKLLREETVWYSASTETCCDVRWGENTVVIHFNSKYLTFLFSVGFMPFLHICVLLFL